MFTEYLLLVCGALSALGSLVLVALATAESVYHMRAKHEQVIVVVRWSRSVLLFIAGVWTIPSIFLLGYGLFYGDVGFPTQTIALFLGALAVLAAFASIATRLKIKYHTEQLELLARSKATAAQDEPE